MYERALIGKIGNGDGDCGCAQIPNSLSQGQGFFILEFGGIVPTSDSRS
jgi:hypothetical protein